MRFINVQLHVSDFPEPTNSKNLLHIAGPLPGVVGAHTAPDQLPAHCFRLQMDVNSFHCVTVLQFIQDPTHHRVRLATPDRSVCKRDSHTTAPLSEWQELSNPPDKHHSNPKWNDEPHNSQNFP